MDKNNGSKKSELAALFDDLQDTLNNSVINNPNANAAKPAKPAESPGIPGTSGTSGANRAAKQSGRPISEVLTLDPDEDGDDDDGGAPSNADARSAARKNANAGERAAAPVRSSARPAQTAAHSISGGQPAASNAGTETRGREREQAQENEQPGRGHGRDRPDRPERAERAERTEKAERVERIGAEVEPPPGIPLTNEFAAIFDDIKDAQKGTGASAPARSASNTSSGSTSSGIPRGGGAAQKPRESPQKAQTQRDLDFELLQTLDGIGMGKEDEAEYESARAQRARSSGRTGEIDRAGMTGGAARSDRAGRAGQGERADGALIGVNAGEAWKKQPRFNGLFRASAKEYTSREQYDGIFNAYQNMYVREFAELVLCGALFLMLAYMEIAPFIGLPLPEILAFYNTVYILINFQLFLLAGWTTQKSLFFGVKSLLRSELNLYAAASVFFIFAAAHTVAAYVMSNPGTQVTLFNSAAALAMLCATLYNIMDLKFEISGFRAVASKKIKYAFNLDSGMHGAPPEEREMFRDIIPHDTAVGRIIKTAAASNFFSRTNRYKNRNESVRLYIFIALAAAAVLSLACIIFFEREVYHTLSGAAFLFFGSVPLCSFISAAYPRNRAQKKSASHGAAFIGDDSIDEYSEVAILSLSDRDIFPPSTVNFSRARVYGNNRIDTALHYLCALFTELNMPASEVFKASIEWDENKAREAAVKIRDIQDNGICYETNGAKLFAGKPEYIENLGLHVPIDADFDDQFLRSSGIMMFLASEHEVIAKIYLNYELTANFHDILRSIRSMNSCVCVKTFDPNVDITLLRRLANMKNFPLRVLKLKDAAETYQIAEKAESGVVSKDSLKSIVNALLIASRTKNIIKGNALIQAIAFCVSLALTAAIALFGPPSISHAGILLALQIFWAVPIIFLSALS